MEFQGTHRFGLILIWGIDELETGVQVAGSVTLRGVILRVQEGLYLEGQLVVRVLQGREKGLA